MPTVLVVDDEADVREITVRMLWQAGYDTAQAVDGRDAWGQLRRAKGMIDAVRADVVMPNMTGTELVALILANRPELPVALMSGFSVSILQARGLEPPQVPLLTKPFTQDQLRALVN
jgi:two-component system, cell cycle sensor histidine kinase and response regulator CckA